MQSIKIWLAWRSVLGFLDHLTEFGFRCRPRELARVQSWSDRLIIYLTCTSNGFCNLAAVNPIAARTLSSLLTNHISFDPSIDANFSKCLIVAVQKKPSICYVSFKGTGHRQKMKLEHISTDCKLSHLQAADLMFWCFCTHRPAFFREMPIHAKEY